MKIILTQHVKGLGREGDEKEVSDGYGRNYLVPRKLAVLATKENHASWEKKRKDLAVRIEAEKTAMKEVADKLEASPFVIHVDVGEAGRLFGSVTSQDIAGAVKTSSGIEIDKRDVVLSGTIKALGTYDVAVRLHPDVTAKIKVEVAEKV